MSGLLIFIVISLVLAPLLKAVGRANRTAPAPKPNPWDEIEWEASQEHEPDYATAELAYQPLDMVPTDQQEGIRSILPPPIEEAQEQPMQIERTVNSFDLRAAVVADAVLNAKYKDQ